MVKIEKVLKHDAPLPHPTVFEHTLGDALESYEIWNVIVTIMPQI